MFNAFINDSDSEIKCTLSRFVDDVKLCGELDTPKEWETIWGDLDKLKKWALHESRHDERQGRLTQERQYAKGTRDGLYENMKRAKRIVKGPGYITQEEWLRRLGLFSLEKKRLKSDLIAVYNFHMRKRRQGGDDLFSLVSGDNTQATL
ncbi:hypothetical protein HGM15179_003532 [Zosterops borbonicus]|uniref:Reverse transcriptase domain-containing protein n=1 Tax=Zosterops borbonicus TaxID=364589 RepID=A0A8K1LS01_9PASS|nr:hypothetical protein HGM15179_003532 [Zosterops borbonicus]